MTEEIKKAEPTNVQTSRRIDPFAAMRYEMDRVFDGFLGRRWPDGVVTLSETSLISAIEQQAKS